MTLTAISNEMDELYLEHSDPECSLLDYEIELRLQQLSDKITADGSKFIHMWAIHILESDLSLRDKWKTLNNLATIELMLE